MSIDWNERWAPAMREVARAETDNFAALVRMAGLDPARHLRFADWVGVDFSGCNLAGFDFTGSRLHGCRFDDAVISGARFDMAELGCVEHMMGQWRRKNPHAPGVVGPIADLRKAADWDAYVQGWKRADALAPDDCLPVGAVFQDAPLAPEMVVVPAGRFVMGSPDGKTKVIGIDGEEIEAPLSPAEEGREKYEGPRHEVIIPAPFAIGRFALTFEEWDAAVAAGGVSPKPEDAGWGRGRRPVMDVSWEDAQAYIKWLSEKTGKVYGLLSESEWEYACRASTTTPFWWGSSISPSQASHWDFTFDPVPKGKQPEKRIPVYEFQPNPWGLYQMQGNLCEWCEDCWNRSYKDKPANLRANGGPWTAEGTRRRVHRGGSWVTMPQVLRAAARRHGTPDHRGIGFRVARTLSVTA